MIKFVILVFLTFTLYAQEFTVASYNVENLFDLKKQNSEYKEYIPNTKSKWNQKNFDKKLINTIRVLKELNADIIALQEVENQDLMHMILQKLPQYKYISFTKYQNSSVGIGFLSKIKIKKNNQININFRKRVYRPILETTFEIDNIEFKIFNNHWPSKRVPESYRIKYAKKLQDRLKALPRDYDYILLGDFNSNYNEMNTFRYDNKLNNTSGITGINQVLNTTINNHYITYEDIMKQEEKVHLNLWLELKSNNRFSTKFRKQNNTPDNIIINSALLDTKKISYIYQSFQVFKPSYLYKNNKINRWQIKRENKYNKVHAGVGYSDHLPIYAKFSSSKKDRNKIKEINHQEDIEIKSINDLYLKNKLIEDIKIKNAIVIYKHRNNAIIKQKNSRAIYLYKNAKELKLGYSYDLKINQIKEFNGLKEVEKFYIINENNKFESYKSLYLSANNIDILDSKYQNEIIKDLKGTIKNNKIYFNNKSIRLYAKDKTILPKNEQTIIIKSGHLAVYRGNVQIIIHKKSDYKVEN